MKAELKTIIEETDKYLNEINEIEKEILGFIKPNVWNVFVKGNMEVELEVEFEKLLASLSEHTNELVDNFSVFRFYAFIDMITEKNTPHGSDNKV